MLPVGLWHAVCLFEAASTRVLLIFNSALIGLLGISCCITLQRFRKARCFAPAVPLSRPLLLLILLLRLLVASGHNKRISLCLGLCFSHFIEAMCREIIGILFYDIYEVRGTGRDLAFFVHPPCLLLPSIFHSILSSAIFFFFFSNF